MLTYSCQYSATSTCFTDVPEGEAFRKSTKSSARFNEALLAMMLQGRTMLGRVSRCANLGVVDNFPGRKQLRSKTIEAFMK